MNIDKLNFIKKSFISFGDKSEKLMIYREQGETDFNFVFNCPKCGKPNDFKSSLQTQKRKDNGKSKEFYVFNCQSCNEEYSVNRLKPPRGKSK
jgi:transcription elongation factor Elf1